MSDNLFRLVRTEKTKYEIDLTRAEITDMLVEENADERFELDALEDAALVSRLLDAANEYMSVHEYMSAKATTEIDEDTDWMVTHHAY